MRVRVSTNIEKQVYVFVRVCTHIHRLLDVNLTCLCHWSQCKVERSQWCSWMEAENLIQLCFTGQCCCEYLNTCQTQQSLSLLRYNGKLCFRSYNTHTHTQNSGNHLAQIFCSVALTVLESWNISDFHKKKWRWKCQLFFFFLSNLMLASIPY